MQGDRELCLQAGMNDYISKPVQVAELRGALERSGQALQESRPAMMSEIMPTHSSNVGPSPSTLDPITSIIDLAVFETLRAGQPPGEPDLVNELITLFLDETPAQLQQIREAVQTNDAAGLRHAAHTLKGGSASLGVMEVARVSAELEKLGRGGAVDGAAALLLQLETEYARACEALNTLRAEARGHG
jgi:HPt (histidine-containing phosphotransfer) domain-containing protein